MVYIISFRETLLGIAKHYETGESLSEDVYQKLLRARTFRAASHTLRQVKSLHYLMVISSDIDRY
jgi:Zn-dependent oligopeptidase